MFRVVFVLVPILWAFAIATDATNNSSTSADKPLIKLTTNTSVDPTVLPENKNATETPQNKGREPHHFETDSSMIQRALYVLIGITLIGVLYFLVRAVRLKKTTVSQRKKRYGLLSNYDEDEEDDEDDVTVYEARSLRR